MNLRKLAFTSSVAPLIAVISVVPVLGTGFALYLSLIVWAGAGLRWWLLALAMSVAVGFATLAQLFMVSTFAASVTPTVSSVIASHPEAALGWLVLQLSMIAIYPSVLYLGKRSFAKMLAKRGLLR